MTRSGRKQKTSDNYNASSLKDSKHAKDQYDYDAGWSKKSKGQAGWSKNAKDQYDAGAGWTKNSKDQYDAGAGWSKNAKKNAKKNDVGAGWCEKNQYDIESVTTASPADSDLDWRSSGSKCSGQWENWQETPPSTPQKTSLRSLKSKAKMFVPTGALDSLPDLPDDVDPATLPPPCMPSPGKEALVPIIQKALGSELWNLNMMDCTDYSGEWITPVEITIPALSASMCHLVASQDSEAIAAAEQANKSQATKSMTEALEDLQPDMVLLPDDQRAPICAEYCPADRRKLCQEFSHFGSCPRGGTCRWAHAMIETFMIHFIVAPLEWGCSTETEGQPAADCEAKPAADAPESAGRWQPKRPPMPPREETLAGLPLADVPANTQLPSLDDGLTMESCPARLTMQKAPAFGMKEAGADKIETIKPLTPDMRPKNPRLVSKKKWSDIQEDDIDDDCLSFSFT